MDEEHASLHVTLGCVLDLGRKYNGIVYREFVIPDAWRQELLVGIVSKSSVTICCEGSPGEPATLQIDASVDIHEVGPRAILPRGPRAD